MHLGCPMQRSSNNTSYVTACTRIVGGTWVAIALDWWGVSCSKIDIVGDRVSRVRIPTDPTEIAVYSDAVRMILRIWTTWNVGRVIRNKRCREIPYRARCRCTVSIPGNDLPMIGDEGSSWSQNRMWFQTGC